MLFAEGPTACPFVALENDRDRRSDEPDHRHRCYAVPVPEARAMAHQRAYCLTAQFTGCPIFQDWAVRAAARPVPLRPIPGPLSPEEQERPREWAAPPAWAAPPNWQHGGERADQLAAFDEPEPGESADRPTRAHGPAYPGGSSADARAVPPPEPAEPRAAPAPGTSQARPAAADIERLPSLPLDAPSAAIDEADEPDQPARAGPPAVARAAASDSAVEPPIDEPAPSAQRAAQSPSLGGPPPERLQAPSYRSAAADMPSPRDPLGRGGSSGSPRFEPPQSGARPARSGSDLARGSQAQRGKPTLRREDVVPTWQRASYPSLGRRLDLGGGGGSWISRITTLFAVLAILGLAVALIILGPSLLGLAGPGGSPTSPMGVASPTPSGALPSPSAAVTPSPTPLAHETWQTYVIVSGDSMCRIAARFGVTYAQLMGANPQVSNPAFIRAGDQLNIPPDDFVPPTPAPDATPVANPCG